MNRMKKVLALSVSFLLTIGTTAAFGSVKNNNSKAKVIVVFNEFAKTEKVKKDIENLFQETEITVLKKNESFGIETVEISSEDDIEKVIKELESHEGVESVQPDYRLSSYNEFQDIKEEDINSQNINKQDIKEQDINPQEIKPLDKYFVLQWGLENFGQLIGVYGTKGVDVKALSAWEITQGSEDVLIGVLDTGMDIQHSDLVQNIYVNREEIPRNNIDDDKNGLIDDITGWDFFNNDNTVYDSFMEDIHGTHVSGIIAAKSNQQGITGVAPNVKILPLKFMSGAEGSTSDAIEAIQYAKKMGVKIINCSWSGKEFNPALRRAMEKSDILFVCSAGNEGLNVKDTPIYPACFKMNNVISVGSLDNQGNVAKFSNYGKDIDVLAPGVNIISTIPNEGYVFGGGTSASVPFVTGIAALVQSIKPEMSSNRIKSLITKNVIKDERYKDIVKSSGMVDMYETLLDIVGKK